MRRENPRWEYRRETSAYDKSDYRSKFYKGKWEKAWIKIESNMLQIKNRVI